MLFEATSLYAEVWSLFVAPLSNVIRDRHWWALLWSVPAYQFQLVSVNICFDKLRFIFDPEWDLTIGCFPLFACLVHNSVQTKGGCSFVCFIVRWWCFSFVSVIHSESVRHSYVVFKIMQWISAVICVTLCFYWSGKDIDTASLLKVHSFW